MTKNDKTKYLLKNASKITMRKSLRNQNEGA